MTIIFWRKYFHWKHFDIEPWVRQQYNSVYFAHVILVLNVSNLHNILLIRTVNSNTHTTYTQDNIILHMMLYITRVREYYYYIIYIHAVWAWLLLWIIVRRYLSVEKGKYCTSWWWCACEMVSGHGRRTSGDSELRCRVSVCSRFRSRSRFKSQLFI